MAACRAAGASIFTAFACLIGLGGNAKTPGALAPPVAKAVPATVIDTSKPIVTLPGGWVEIDRPIVITDGVGKIIRGDGTVNLRYVGPPTPAVILLRNCQRCKIEGIYEIHCGKAAAGIALEANDDSPISVNDNVIDGALISGGDYGIVVGDGAKKSISENTIKSVQLHGRKAGLRVNSGNGQNIYLDRVRVNGCPIGIDLVNGGLQDRGGIITYCDVGIKIGRLSNVGLLSGSYSEGCKEYLITEKHSTNPGQLTMTGCHVQGDIRWETPGPLTISGCEIDGLVHSGGQAITPVTVTGTTFLNPSPFRRKGDTGTFIALGCQCRIQETHDSPVHYSPITVAQFAGDSGLQFDFLSWGPSSGRGLRVGTHYGKTWGGTKWDGGGRVGGGESATQWKPKESK
jgi:hypothetical protein